MLRADAAGISGRHRKLRATLLAALALTACSGPAQVQHGARASKPPAPVAATASAPAPAISPALLGTYGGAGCDGVKKVPQFEQWLGRKLDVPMDFLAADSWPAMLSTAAWVAKCWHDGGYGQIVLAIPLLPRDGQASLQAGAAGAYDATFRQIAEYLVHKGYGGIVLRLGWEFNGNWFPWSANREPALWVACWRHVVEVMRGVPGAHFRFDWNPVVGAGAVSPVPAYPGDDYVDVIGGDVYNQNWDPHVTTAQQRWDQLRHASFGLEWQQSFAAAHHKPMSYPEWGTGTRPDGHGGGDDPLFITNMAAWIHTHHVLYQSYWNYPAADYNAKLSDGSKPLAGAAFIKAFGVAP